jgi:hypothetical protein
MNRELNYITCCPDDTYYTWQVHLWLESLREIGQSEKAIVLVFIPKNRIFNDKWNKIVTLYPESKFEFIKDEDNATQLLGIYIPILRPYVMWRYFKDHPDMANKAIFYCDSDILFTKDFNIDNFINDDVCYLSDTNSYINASYFDSKVNDVLPDKLEEYKSRDILAELTKNIGITREICEKNNNNSGGAQYLLKNVDVIYWEKVMKDCITIRLYLQSINREFFESENKGFQSWCADMWAVLWNLWHRDKETKVVKELDFAWSTDPIEKLDRMCILHNAGVTGNMMGEIPCFYKGHYHRGEDPLLDPHIDVILNSDIAKTRCNWYYTNKLKQLKQKYNLTY